MENGTSHGTRERRFKKLYLGAESKVLDGDEIEDAVALGIEIDGQILELELEGINELVMKRLLFDGLYDRLTRAVHTAKPKATDTDAAMAVIEEVFAKVKSGSFKKTRTGGSGAPRSFDPSRFKTAVYAAAKAMGQSISEEKFERLLQRLTDMSGKDRQSYISKNFLRDPNFKVAWEAPILAKKKAAIKKGEVQSALADLTD